MTIQQKKGIVSEEGLERLVKKCALDTVWQQARADLKILTIAGATFAVDVSVTSHKVQRVELQYAFAGPNVTKHTAKAEAVLLDNLKLATGQLPWTKKLDDFANNLESLAALDKLCIIDEKKGALLVTYDAIAGLYESLRKIHEYEVQQLRQEPTYTDKPDTYIRAIATCERSGRPLIHEKGIVGLRLDYWRNQRYFNPPPAKAEQWYTKGKQWSILVSCARRDPMVYPGAVRVSDAWIGEEVELPATEGLLPLLNWQQPPDIVLPEKPGDELLLTGPRMPEVMFMAVLDPPVALPITVWEQIHHYSGAPVAHAPFMQTFDYLIFPVMGHYNPTEPRAVETRKIVNAKQKDATFKQVAHENRLFIHKPVYGQTLAELPFSHPSQLINMLPTLRQYAFLWNLLDKSFGSQAQQRSAAKAPDADGGAGDGSIKLTARSDEYATFRSDAATETAATEIADTDTRIDVTLNAHPQPNPKLQIMFLFQGRAAEVNVDIGANGVVTVESTNVVNDLGQVLDGNGHPQPGSIPDQSRSKARLARMLMYFENIDTWCEWIRVNIPLD